MNQPLKSIIVRDPVSGRIFAVEKITRPQAATITLRRLDREPREQSRIYRPRTEIQGWEVLESREESVDHFELVEACRGLLEARRAHRHPFPGITVKDPVLDPHLDRIADLVRP